MGSRQLLKRFDELLAKFDARSRAAENQMQTLFDLIAGPVVDKVLLVGSWIVIALAVVWALVAISGKG